MSRSKTIAKILALIIGGLALLFFGAFIFGEGIPDLRDPANFQLKTMLMLMIFAAFGYVFSFWRSKEGGIVLTFTGFLLGMNMFYHGGLKDIIATLIYSLPFLIPGVLLWWTGSHDE